MYKDQEDDLENRIRHVAKQVRKESKDIPLDTTKYRLIIDEQRAHESVSGTVQNLPASISTKLDSTHPEKMLLRSGGLSLSKVGDITIPVQDSLGQSTSSIVSCYGHPESASLTDARQKIWSLRVSRSIGAAPKLQILPPTNEAFVENVVRAHLQEAIWKQAQQRNPPNIDPLMHGGTQREGSTSLTPTTVANDVTIASDELLKMIKCSCSSATPCKYQHCGCHKANMACAALCVCQCGDGCFNEKTKERVQADKGTDDEMSDHECDSVMRMWVQLKR